MHFVPYIHQFYLRVKPICDPNDMSVCNHRFDNEMLFRFHMSVCDHMYRQVRCKLQRCFSSFCFSTCHLCVFVYHDVWRLPFCFSTKSASHGDSKACSNFSMFALATSWAWEVSWEVSWEVAWDVSWEVSWEVSWKMSWQVSWEKGKLPTMVQG